MIVFRAPSVEKRSSVCWSLQLARQLFYMIHKTVAQKYTFIVSTLRLHYKAVLYNPNSIIKQSPRGSQIFFQYTVCENVSRRSRYTQCKLWKLYSLPQKHSSSRTNTHRNNAFFINLYRNYTWSIASL